MPLSEYEQRVLEQMERQLASDDPKLADTFQAPKGQSRSGARYVLAGLGVIGGLLLLVLGVAQSIAAIGVLGFAIMFAAVVFAFSKPHNKPEKSNSGPIGAVGPDGRIRGRRNEKQDFMRRLEERWDRRHEEGH